MSYRSGIANRRAVLGCIAMVAATLAACADQATAPSIAGRAVPSASNDKFNLSSATSTLEWEATARSLIASHSTVSPIAAGRIYALLGVGQYGAVVAADGGEDPTGGGRALYEARRGAVAGASATVLSYIFPDAATALESQVAADGAEGPGNTHPHFTRGVVTGREMGARMIAWGRTDGFSVPWNGLPFPDPLGGGWSGAAGAPAGFQFPKMRPYYLTSQNQFRSPPPPIRGSAEFLANLDAVRTAALNRTAADVAFANFWNLSNGTETALGYWDERAADFIAAGGLSERDAAHVFALVNSTALDAVIGCWDAKYYYMYLRPSMADPSIMRSPGVPGFPYNLPNHPSYPSGHSCVSASATRVLARFFPDQTASLADQVAEAGRSRVVGGIHYPSDIVAGQALGRAVADWAMAYDQQPGGLLRAIPR